MPNNTIMFHFKLGEKVSIRNHDNRYVNAIVKSQADKDHYMVSCIDTLAKSRISNFKNMGMPKFIERTFHKDDLYPFELTQSKLWSVLE